VHDTVYFEVQGRPSVFLASTEFVDAAQAQSVALGLPEVRRVFVPHPIQDAIDPEMWAKAEAAFDEIVAALLDA
jgi:hypothetical protein